MFLLCLCGHLFICALWSPAGKGLTYWLSFVVSNCGFVTFPLVSWVRCPNTLSLVSFAGMTLYKCIVLRMGALTGCPLCRESHPLCRLKNPTVISIWSFNEVTKTC